MQISTNVELVPLESQIAAVKREIALRNRVYPGLISTGKKKPLAAEVDIAQMIAVLRTLEWFQRHEAEIRAWVAGGKQANENFDEKSLADRLARSLADATETPVMKVRDTLGGPEIELRIGAWLPEISERAAELLEEAGR